MDGIKAFWVKKMMCKNWQAGEEEAGTVWEVGYGEIWIGLVTKGFQLCHRAHSTYLEDNWKPWKNFKQWVLWSGLSFGEIPATEFGNGEIGLGDLQWRVEKAGLGAGWIWLHDGFSIVFRERKQVCSADCVDYVTGVPSFWDRAGEERTCGEDAEFSCGS